MRRSGCERTAWAACIYARADPNGTRTRTAAAKGGHLEVLKWARANKCPWDEDVRERRRTATSRRRSGRARTTPVEQVDAATAENGHLETLKGARTAARGTRRRARWRRRAATSRSSGRARTTAREHGRACTRRTAATSRCSSGCARTTARGTRTCKRAWRGHLEVLWARENDCPWNEATCAWAAEGGHLEVLKWARANGCPWTKRRANSRLGSWDTSAWRRRKMARTSNERAATIDKRENDDGGKAA